MIAERADDVVLGIGLQRAGGLLVNHHTQKVEFEGDKNSPLHQPANIRAVEVL